MLWLCVGCSDVYVVCGVCYVCVWVDCVLIVVLSALIAG